MEHEKQIMVIGDESAGKYELIAAMQKLANATYQVASKMQTLVEQIEKQKPFVIKNHYPQDEYVFDGRTKKNKPKKAYWHKGNLKYK